MSALSNQAPPLLTSFFCSVESLHWRWAHAATPWQSSSRLFSWSGGGGLAHRLQGRPRLAWGDTICQSVLFLLLFQLATWNLVDVSIMNRPTKKGSRTNVYKNTSSLPLPSEASILGNLQGGSEKNKLLLRILSNCYQSFFVNDSHSSRLWHRSLPNVAHVHFYVGGMSIIGKKISQLKRD